MRIEMHGWIPRNDNGNNHFLSSAEFLHSGRFRPVHLKLWRKRKLDQSLHTLERFPFVHKSSYIYIIQSFPPWFWHI